MTEAAQLDRWHLAVYNPRSDVLETISAYLPGYEQLTSTRLHTTDTHPLTSTLRMTEPLIINDPRSLPQNYRPVYGKSIATPIRTGDQAIGALIVGRSVESANLDEADARLVSTLASQIAVALENQRLFLQAQAEQKTLSSTLATLPAGVIVLDSRNLLPIITNERARELLGDRVDKPFSIENYQLIRSDTFEPYPEDQLCVYATQATQEPASKTMWRFARPTARWTCSSARRRSPTSPAQPTLSC